MKQYSYRGDRGCYVIKGSVREQVKHFWKIYPSAKSRGWLEIYSSQDYGSQHLGVVIWGANFKDNKRNGITIRFFR
jgi:hypothetical protein